MGRTSWGSSTQLGAIGPGSLPDPVPCFLTPRGLNVLVSLDRLPFLLCHPSDRHEGPPKAPPPHGTHCHPLSPSATRTLAVLCSFTPRPSEKPPNLVHLHCLVTCQDCGFSEAFPIFVLLAWPCREKAVTPRVVLTRKWRHE